MNARTAIDRADARDAALRTLFDAARAVDVRDVCERLGGDFRRAWRAGGAGWVRAKICLLCDGVDCLSVSCTGFRCHRCGVGGDGVALARTLKGFSAVDAAAWLTGFDVRGLEPGAYSPAAKAEPLRVAPPRAERAPAPTPTHPTQSLADRLLREARRGAPEVVVYLTARGVLPAVASRACHTLGYVDRVPWSRDVTTPALVTALGAPGSPVAGVHVTHLAPDGRGKADLKPAKKMHGVQTTFDGRPAGAWVLSPPDGQTPAGLVLAEGVETTLALAGFVEAALGAPVAAYAALSLDRLQGGLRQRARGGVDWRKPGPDPARPAAGPHFAGRVFVGVDADCAPLTVDRGTRFEQVVSPARRAEVAGLCAAHWARQRGATDVRILTPPDGLDWADVALRERGEF